MKWQGDQPIYLQLKEKIVAGILEGVFPEGEALPSIRQVAVDYQLNHITIAKAYQLLVEEGLLEKRRGLGMFVNKGAQQNLLKSERARFLDKEWPLIYKRVKRLHIKIEDLINE